MLSGFVRRSLRLAGFILLTTLIGCGFVAPFISLSGVPPLLSQGQSVLLTAQGNPGSSAGPMSYSFSANCGGSFTPNPIGPTHATTVQTTYNSTGASLGLCVLSALLTTATGQTANASAQTTILAGPTASWLLAGNAGTNPSTDFLGTTDAQPLIVKTNNTE